ncbi:mercuric transporter MerT family protein [Legionella quateirensis]|uniref:Mercuric transport protein MerT n=1 Tax=Legionella quateirensis TaxID=45072 RepID=A0A378P8W2_9GAMM|nr:mercuric transporter MerT family protein [Legionella quateirensis]KTD53892.1 MerT mercuric transport protein [Legionella quateirensis]STY83057.1 putative mercuric transport protein [Legionella quateirensis]
MKNPPWTISALGGAIIGALTASLCCIGPGVLLAFGISGAWVSTFTQLEFLRPIGLVITLGFLMLAFWKLYLEAPQSCSADKPCALRIQRFIFWVITLLLILLLAFPRYAFLFY